MATVNAQVLALHLTRQGAERLREMVSQSQMARLAGLEASLEEFERKAVQLQPEILLIEYAADHARLPDLLERLRRNVPRGVVIAWSSSRDPDHILGAMRLGVREYLTEPAPAQSFNEAVLRLRREAKALGRPSGRLMGVMGAKGGVGSSHLAINLAWALSQHQGQRVALVDFDRSGGDLAFMLDLEPERDMTDLARNFDRLDGLFMDSLMVEVAPGLRLLAAPTDQAAAEEIRTEHLSRALDHLVNGHGVVVMDISSRLDEVSLLALDRAEAVLLVVEPSVVSLKSARRLLDLCERLGYGPDKMTAVVSRCDAQGAVKAKDVQAALGQPVVAWLPNDTAAVMEAGNAGRPVLKERPRAAWSKEVSKLAQSMLKGLGPKSKKESPPAEDQPEAAASDSATGLFKGRPKDGRLHEVGGGS